MASTRALASAVSGRVELGEQQGQGDDGAGVEAALDGQVAAEAVDDGQGQGRHERQRGHEHVLAHGRAHADLGHPLGPGAELGLLARRAAEQLHEGGARRRTWR